MDVIVIGAGIAGLTAAATLQQAGLRVMILEARGRIGGRIFTRRDLVDGVPVEMGAEFIHGEYAPTWELVSPAGLNVFHWQKGDESLVRSENGELHTMRALRRVDAAFNQTRTWDLPGVMVNDQDEDLYLYLNRLGFTREQLRYVRRTYANAAGGDIHHLSAKATLEEIYDDTRGTQDYRILEGYDSILSPLSANLDIQLNTPVIGVDWGQTPIRVEAAGGQMFEAAQLLISVPVGVLHHKMVTFNPVLPPEKHEAIADIPMGQGLKLVFLFDQPVLPQGVAALYSAGNPPMWWSPSVGRAHPTAQFILTGFATGDWASRLVGLGERGMISAALRSLRAELGEAAVPHPARTVVMNWSDEPFTRGVYSYTRPGATKAREIYAAPTANRLFWAGEATASNAWAGTVHGGYASGLRAAGEILSSR